MVILLGFFQDEAEILWVNIVEYFLLQSGLWRFFQTLVCWILLIHSSLHNELNGNTIGEERFRNEFRQ